MKYFSPAKINLFLHITGKRPDNFHELFTLMCPVNLYDTLSFAFDTGEITVSCCHPEVPEDETNLAYRAATLFFDRLGKNNGVAISIEKKIPVGAGLGGGSSNAATVLHALNQHYLLPFSEDELREMGLLLGADVPFFIFGKPAVATGIGEKLKPCTELNPFELLLIFPGFSVSTADVYKNFNLRLTNCHKRLKYHLFKGRDFDAERHLYNDLEAVTASRYPDVDFAKEILLQHGAIGSLMSGSGPTVFGLFSDTRKMEEARFAIGSGHCQWQVYYAQMIV